MQQPGNIVNMRPAKHPESLGWAPVYIPTRARRKVSFLWKDYQASEGVTEEKAEALADEVADIAVYLFELADNLGLKLGAAMLTKMAKNAAKYPVEKARGSNKKYTEL